MLTKLNSALLAAGASLLIGCSASSTATRTYMVSSETLTEGRTLQQSATALDIEARNGTIRVRADSAVSSIEISAVFKGRADDETEAESRVDLMDIETRWNERGALEIRPVIRAEGEEGEWRSGEGASFSVVAPSLGSATLVSSNGAIEVTGAEQGCSIETSNGPVTVRGCSGDVSVSTSNGGVSVEGATGTVRVRTSNGGVSVVDQLGPVDGQTSNGRMFVALRQGGSSTFALRTSNGSVEVETPPDWSGEIAASTSNGRIRIDGEGTATRRSRGRADLVLGRGGSPSTISTSNGAITIRSR